MIYKKPKTIGIVGGMGPQAGIALYENIVNNTRATTDQQHLSVVLMAFPGDIDDRTLFLEGKALANPAYEIVKIIEKLSASGAEVIGVACNTSHSPAIFDIITSEVNKLKSEAILLNMPYEVCNYISAHHPGISKVGLMTTNGLYKSGLYKILLQQRGYEVVIPDFTFQDRIIHRMIYDPDIGIKANKNTITQKVKSFCDEALSFFKENNADAVILGCTELSLVLKMNEVHGMQIIDSTKCLAKALIREAMASDTGNIRQQGLSDVNMPNGMAML